MRVLITGGAGNIGQEVVRLLQERGDDPAVYDRMACPNSGVRSETGDINDSERLARAIEGCKAEGIVHLASMLQFGCDADPVGAVKVNVNGTLSTLEAARRAGVERFVLASSVAVYGSTADVLDEKSPIQADVSVYGASKLLAERLLRRYRAIHGMTCRTVRFSTVLSNRPVTSPGIAAVVAEIFGIASGCDVTISGVAADELRHYVYFRDAARGAVLALMADGCSDDLFNIAGGEDAHLSFRQLAELVRNACPGAGQVTFTGRSGNRGRVNGKRAAAQLGYRPLYTTERAVKEVIESCVIQT